MRWPLTGRGAVLDHAVGLIESGSGIAFLGPSGVGKSRLLHELVDRIESAGIATLRVAASESTNTIPLGPFVDLLPETPTEDRLAMLSMTLATLRSRATSRGLLLAVDDAHHLDPMSRALLINVVTSESAIVCLTARTGEKLNSDLVGLWTNSIIERVDLSPLSEADSRALAEAALGPMDQDLADELWRLSRGNPLVLHELIEGAEGKSITTTEDGVWVKQGELTGSPRLADLVTSRLSRLPEPLRRDMELIAVGAPLPGVLAHLMFEEGLADLEQRNLVRLTPLVDDIHVLPAHPLYGEILDSQLPETRRRMTCRRLVEAALELGDGIDPLRVALWQRQSGEILSRDVALRGAAGALARHDATMAQDLLEQLPEVDDWAAVLLGRSLTYQRRFDEAERVLRDRDPTDDGLRADLASARAHNLGFGLDRVSEAVELLDRVAATLPGPMRARLDTERGVLAAIRGDFTDAERAGRSVLGNPEASLVARASAYVNLSLALSMTADCDGFENIVDQAYQSTRQTRIELPLGEDQVGVMHFPALAAAGRIDESVALLEGAAKRSAGSMLESTWVASLAMGHDLKGFLRRGLEDARRAQALMEETDPFHLEFQVRGVMALERGQLGDEEAMGEVEDIVFGHPDPRISIWVDRGRVWALTARGETDKGAELAARHGMEAVSSQHIFWGALALHDAVRLGHPELVAGDLAALQSTRGAHLINAMADHAAALTDRDPDALTGVARGLATMGASLLAAEAAAQAAALADGLAAALAACLSMGWERECEDPVTPALAARPPLVTGRELQMALDAAGGMSSPEISQRRYISVRTVDNHLRSVYRKLGVGGRGELGDVLAPIVGRVIDSRIE
ncbi:MAG: AAA family ATPase [Acidimicrobiia bacterium]